MLTYSLLALNVITAADQEVSAANCTDSGSDGHSECTDERSSRKVLMSPARSGSWSGNFGSCDLLREKEGQGRACKDEKDIPTSHMLSLRSAWGVQPFQHVTE